MEKKGVIEAALLKVKENQKEACNKYMTWLKEVSSTVVLYENEITDYVQCLMDGQYEIGIDNINSVEERSERYKKLSEMIEKEQKC